MSAAEETLDHGERLKREVQAMMAPLREHYKEVESEIKETEQKLIELRAAKTDLLKLIRISEPGFGGDQRRFNLGGAKNGRGKDTRVGRVTNYSPERLGVLTTWLQEHAEELNVMNDGDGFVASHVARDYTVPGIASSQSTFSKMLLALHEQGIVRLSRIGTLSGGRGNSRAKLYKVVV